MRLKQFAIIAFAATALVGCNDTLDSVDLSHVKNKVEHPLPNRILADMKKKGMERHAPIMLRVFKEEGVLEVWKAKTNNRFDKIAEYEICAWSGRLGPKLKEGDRQAPEGFYNLSPAHLNPHSNYYLAINTGFPNRFDQANGRTGSNLMIHGACSSSGCYSMTDAQMLEIFAFARDAFKGGQQTVQLQAFPFRMTAENMARHRHSQHYDFWKVLKTGYDHFEVTKRPPVVNTCDRTYVFNQEMQSGSLNAAAACPPMSTPPALASSLATYEKEYKVSYEKALKKYQGMAWYDPSEAERKALVADKRKGRDLAYAPTGSSLKAGKLMKESEFAALTSGATAKPTAPQTTAPAAAQTAIAAATPAPVAPAAPTEAPTTATASIPVPEQNPLAYAPAAPEISKKRPFWKLWSTE